MTPLMEACEEGGSAEIVQFLVHSGADPNHADANGDTALHHVCRHGDTFSIRALLRLGADASLIDNDGQCVLHHLSGRGSECMHELVAAGAPVNHRDKEGQIPLHLACDIQSVSLVRALVAEDANTELRDNIGRPPMDYAEGDVDVIDALQGREHGEYSPSLTPPTA